MKTINAVAACRIPDDARPETRMHTPRIARGRIVDQTRTVTAVYAVTCILACVIACNRTVMACFDSITVVAVNP